MRLRSAQRRETRIERSHRGHREKNRLRDYIIQIIIAALAAEHLLFRSREKENSSLFSALILIENFWLAIL